MLPSLVTRGELDFGQGELDFFITHCHTLRGTRFVELATCSRLWECQVAVLFSFQPWQDIVQSGLR